MKRRRGRRGLKGKRQRPRRLRGASSLRLRARSRLRTLRAAPGPGRTLPGREAGGPGGRAGGPVSRSADPRDRCGPEVPVRRGHGPRGASEAARRAQRAFPPRVIPGPASALPGSGGRFTDDPTALSRVRSEVWPRPPARAAGCPHPPPPDLTLATSPGAAPRTARTTSVRGVHPPHLSGTPSPRAESAPAPAVRTFRCCSEFPGLEGTPEGSHFQVLEQILFVGTPGWLHR
ncbi:multiple C2 and transmembrane domain-containing protein 1-like [Mustela lutreola]|uniref:multiple C2 and transmembrane domain-containing protein 1-like n=1 Tax=Mustela lutreola TaxID=9666 RepID=UPI002797700D|nr:multiple C2 and transmembrane domain-containing protein 1-like [Mustela lutreola]